MLRVSNSTQQKKLLALLVGKGGRPLWNMGKASISQEHLALLMYLRLSELSVPWRCTMVFVSFCFVTTSPCPDYLSMEADIKPAFSMFGSVHRQLTNEYEFHPRLLYSFLVFRQKTNGFLLFSFPNSYLLPVAPAE